MSLFICSQCSCVDNNNLIEPGTDEKYPNLAQMDMMEISEINGKSRMLCSECNTGKWHGEFSKHMPTEIEKEYTKYSEYGFCTVFDHPVSFDEFEKIYNSDRYDYFKEKLNKAFQDNERLDYDPEKDELYSKKEMQYKRIMSKILPLQTLGMLEMFGNNNQMYSEYSVKKEPQTKEQKNTMLERARLKRERKAKIKAKHNINT